MASGTRSRTAAQACLVRLPDSCLLAVMQCCADDTRSVLSAATAHSRLQRAAVEALSRLSAKLPYQAQVESLLLYLAKHGQHVHSLDLCAADDVQLLELPPSLTKLDSLQLGEDVTLQLQPGDGAQGVLRAGLPLTRLELSGCDLLDGTKGLAAALVQLPDLQHLSVDINALFGTFVFPTYVLSHLTKLTSIKLPRVECQDSSSNSSDPSAALQPLQALTRLADLQLGSTRMQRVTANMLSDADQLPRLVMQWQELEPRALAGKTQLQHLAPRGCRFVPGTGVAQLLSELQHLTQLTHLDLGGSCRWRGDAGGPLPPPSAYASLTASSRLQHLDVSGNILPSAAWQYMCPPGRTLPHLRCLNIRGIEEEDRSRAAPNTSALVSCCPSLQSLATSMPCSTAQLAPLRRLTGLRTLVVGSGHDDDLEGVQALCQLTGLQDLVVWGCGTAGARVLQLTQLTRLTALTFPKRHGRKCLKRHSQDPGSVPVWRQLLQQLVASPDAEVAQQAAAALAAA